MSGASEANVLEGRSGGGVWIPSQNGIREIWSPCYKASQALTLILSNDFIVITKPPKQ